MINIIPTQAFTDQKPGTSGLRKKVTVFQQPHYVENFIQSIFNSLSHAQGKLLVMGGDGRYFNREAIGVAIRMAAARGFGRILVGQGGLLSTPAASHLIRKYAAIGGLIFSASHNAGGPLGDFGIKYNIENGGPAPEKMTDLFYSNSQKITQYKISDQSDFDLDTLGEYRIENTVVQVIDPVIDYLELMQSLFDFPALRQFFQSGFTMRFDAMHAITGPYAHRIFEDVLGAPQGTVINGTPLTDFGGYHPDPNLAHAHALYTLMMADDAPDFGAASDGDGDRNLIIGRNQYVSPSDSLALIVANIDCVPAYAGGLSGVARSMPTSAAVDRVAQSYGVKCYETPTGWKFFGNLLDAGLITICGEESAGTGSHHIREKDGLWAVLFWMSILAKRQESLARLVHLHWGKYGRNYYTRHDYEEIPAKAGQEMMAHIQAHLGQTIGQKVGTQQVVAADNFSYHDPVDDYVTENQGFRLIFDSGARLIYRLSGTGTSGATLRIYIENYDAVHTSEDPQTALQDFIAYALRFAHVEAFTGMTQPSVIT